MDNEDEEYPTWDLIDIIVDVIFGIDLLMTFFCPFFDQEGHLISDMWPIAKNYLKFWFWLDLLSIFPFELIMMTEENKKVGKLSVLTRVAKLPRLYRMLKIMKMFRSLKVTRQQNNIWTQLYNLLYLSPGMSPFSQSSTGYSSTSPASASSAT